MDRIKGAWGELYMLAQQRGVRFSEFDKMSGGGEISKTLFFLGAAGMLGIFTDSRAQGEDVDSLTAELVAELDEFLSPNGDADKGTLQ